jgi:hypothetical protein
MHSVAKTVLMPGDPLRAKFIAENYLEAPTCYNEVRGMLGFTGRCKSVSVNCLSPLQRPPFGVRWSEGERSEPSAAEPKRGDAAPFS